MPNESGDEPRRGPGRPPKSVPEGGEKTHAVVVYSPLDAGDPHTTTTHGITFKANVPQRIALDHHIPVEGAKERINVVDTLRGNAWFSVDGKSHKRVKAQRESIPLAGSDIDPVAADDKRMVELDD